MAAPESTVNLKSKLDNVQALWSPRVVAEMNGLHFKVVKLQGDFVWHCHEDTDETFLVLKGEMVVEFRDREVTLREGELFVVPKGVEHITRAQQECHALIIEPAGVINTGEAGSVLTAPLDEWI